VGEVIIIPYYIVVFMVKCNHTGGVAVSFVPCISPCSVSSNIAQAFLLQILEAFLHTEIQVRFGALQAVVLILRQGLVHPAQVGMDCVNHHRGGWDCDRQWLNT